MTDARSLSEISTALDAAQPAPLPPLDPMLELMGKAIMAYGARKAALKIIAGGRLTVLGPRSRADLRLIRKENPQCQ